MVRQLLYVARKMNVRRDVMHFLFWKIILYKTAAETKFNLNTNPEFGSKKN